MILKSGEEMLKKRVSTAFLMCDDMVRRTVVGCSKNVCTVVWAEARQDTGRRCSLLIRGLRHSI